MMKIHILKRTSEGRVSRTMSECGKHILGNKVNVGCFVKTKQFNQILESGGVDSVCIHCLNRAKKQGRIS